MLLGTVMVPNFNAAQVSRGAPVHNWPDWMP